MFELEPEHTPPSAPILDVEALSSDEDLKRAKSANEYLAELAFHSRLYSESLSLTTFSSAMIYINSRTENDQRDLRRSAVPGWLTIAARSAVFSARNYWKALEGLEGLPGSIAAWRDKMDFAGFKAAKKAFETCFPEVDRARHSLAHPEFYANPDMDMIPEGSVLPTDHYNGYTVIFEGRLIRCEVSEGAASFLVENASRVFAAFARLKHRAPEGSAPERSG